MLLPECLHFLLGSGNFFRQNLFQIWSIPPLIHLNSGGWSWGQSSNLNIIHVNNETILKDVFLIESNQGYVNLPVGEAQLGLHFEIKPFPRQINSKDKSKLKEKSTSLKIISEPQWTSLRLTRTLTCKCEMVVFIAKQINVKDQLTFF